MNLIPNTTVNMPFNVTNNRPFLTRYPENDTNIVTQSRYYKLEEFDNSLVIQIGQIVLFALCSAFISIINSFVMRTIHKKENLQTIANILISILFIIDVGYALFITITLSVAISMGKIWLTESTAKVLSFWSMVFPNLQYITLALMSFEKYIYCVYPFKHQIWFTSKKTLIALGVSAILITLYNFVINVTYPATFYPTAVLCYHNYETALIIYVNSTIYYVLFSFRVFLQFGSFAWIVLFQFLIFASSIRTRIQIGKNKKASNMPQKVLIKMWRRLLMSAFSLFSVVSLYILSWSWFVLGIIRLTTLSSVTERIGFIITIFLPSVINPVAILLGNKPLRQAVFNKIQTPAWLQERTGMTEVKNQQNYPMYNERMGNKDYLEQSPNRCNECNYSLQKKQTEIDSPNKESSSATNQHRR